MKSDLHDVEVYLHHETDKAWLISRDGKRDGAVWMPKSQAELDRDPRARKPSYTLTAPEQILTDKGLV